jgi:hypothetical protein
MSADTYTAASIRVLTEADVVERWDWAKINVLASQYGADPGFVGRAIEACNRAGVPIEHFVQRYLQGDRTAPRRPALDEAMRQVALEDRDRRWGSATKQPA